MSQPDRSELNMKWIQFPESKETLPPLSDSPSNSSSNLRLENFLAIQGGLPSEISDRFSVLDQVLQALFDRNAIAKILWPVKLSDQATVTTIQRPLEEHPLSNGIVFSKHAGASTDQYVDAMNLLIDESNERLKKMGRHPIPPFTERFSLDPFQAAFENSK